MSLRRGIEPIIATVILVAVALIIAVAVVGYLMGLFGGLAGGTPQISITSITAKNETDKGLKIELYLSNAGAGSDKLIRIEIIHGGSSTTVNVGNNVTGLTVTNNEAIVPGNFRGWVTISAGYKKAAPGDTVILRLYFERSGVQTINVVVSP